MIVLLMLGTDVYQMNHSFIVRQLSEFRDYNLLKWGQSNY